MTVIANRYEAETPNDHPTNVRLAKAARAGDAVARERLILGNIRLGLYHASRILGRPPVEDLRSVVYQSVVEAADRWNPEKPWTFSGCLRFVLRRRLEYALSQEDTLNIPPSLYRRKRCLQDKLEGTRPALQDIAEGETAHRCTLLALLSPQWGCLENSDAKSEDAVGESLSPAVMELDFMGTLHKSLAKLKSHERLVVELRLGVHPACNGEPFTIGQVVAWLSEHPGGARNGASEMGLFENGGQTVAGGEETRLGREGVRKTQNRGFAKLRKLMLWHNPYLRQQFYGWLGGAP